MADRSRILDVPAPRRGYGDPHARPAAAVAENATFAVDEKATARLRATGKGVRRQTAGRRRRAKS